MIDTYPATNVPGSPELEPAVGMQDLPSRLEFAIKIARGAGRVTLNYFLGNNFQVERKSDDSPVTQADRGAEQYLREQIASAYPQDGLLGEEFGEQPGTSAYRWVLDPIDGTKSFISGVPLYSVLVGIQRDEESVAGVVLIPALDEIIYAHEGCRAWWQRGDSTPVPARVANRPLSAGVFLVSQVDGFEQRGAAGAYRQLEKTASITRSWGDGYGYLLVATGRADAMVDPIMNLWDAAPLPPILAEAGGAFRDWHGRVAFNGEGVGCSQRVLEEVLAITRAHGGPDTAGSIT